MAKLKPGIFGQPTGRIGNVVFYILNGQLVSRMIGEQKNTPSLKQKGNRKTMKVVMDALKPLQRFIKLGFEHKAKGTVCNPFNLATSYNKQNAVQGQFPNISINYTKLKLSSGTLPLAKDLKITKTAGGLIVKWDATHQWAGDQYDDAVMVALYHPLHKKSSLFLNAGKREQGECFLELTDENVLNEPIEAYLCFKSADGESISDSTYLGNLNGTRETEEEKEERQEYVKIKTRFEQAKERYLKQQAIQAKTGIKNKSFRNTEKEYEVLKARYDEISGYFILSSPPAC